MVIDKSNKVVQEVTDQKEVEEDHLDQPDTMTLTSNKFNQEEKINQEAKTEAVSEEAEEEPSEKEVNSEPTDKTEIEETTVNIEMTEDHNNKEEVVPETIWT